MVMFSSIAPGLPGNDREARRGELFLKFREDEVELARFGWLGSRATREGCWIFVPQCALLVTGLPLEIQENAQPRT